MDSLTLEQKVNRFFAGALFVLHNLPQRLLVDLHPECFDLRVWGDLQTVNALWILNRLLPTAGD